MKQNRIPLLLCALLMVWTYTPAAAQPNYASPESQEIIEKMVEAHGGLDKWRSAEAISIEHILHIPNGPWMVKREIVEISTRRIYSDWPLLRSQIAFDGEKTWSIDWSGMLPPNSTLYTGFVSTNLVWLTQDQGANLSAPHRAKFPGPDGGDTDYHVIRMTYDGGDDYYELYIEPEGYRLRGFETIVTHGGMLDAMGMPPEVKFFGPMVHDFRFYAEVEGLVFPQQWISRMAEDGEEIGHHLVLNHALTSFDEARMRMPSDAVIDKTTKERQMK